MKKTRKKKQVCSAACFMAAEIKFSKDIRQYVVCPFVIPFSLSSCHCIIIKFSGIITIDDNDAHAKDQGQSHGHRGKKNLPKFCHFWTLIQFQFTDGYEMMHKAWSGIDEMPCYLIICPTRPQWDHPPNCSTETDVFLLASLLTNKSFKRHMPCCMITTRSMFIY